MALVDIEKLKKVLGRDVTADEASELVRKLENTLNCQLTPKRSVKHFSLFEYYDILPLPLCQEVFEVRLNGEIVTPLKMFNDEAASGLVNRLKFLEHYNTPKAVTVEARWGIDQLPEELYALLAHLNTENNSNIQSKHIEDYSVTYFAPSEAKNAHLSALKAKYGYYTGGVRNVSV